MSNGLKKFAKYTLIIIGSVLLGYAAVSFIDAASDGVLLEWFSYRFINEIPYRCSDGTTVIQEEFALYSFKNAVMLAAVIILGIIAAVAVTVHAVTVRRTRRAELKRISELIDRCMMKQTDPFSESETDAEYITISAQLAEIRADILLKEQTLKAESERKNDLIAYLAHDLKTPLTSIIGYLSLLSEAPDMPLEQRAKFTDISLDKALRLEQLINEFFEITRYNLSHIELSTERIDLSYMLVQMSDEFYPLLSSHGNRIELNAEDNITVTADAQKLSRVFNNILKNAISYSYPDSVIEVSAHNSGDSVIIAFSNRGPTIPTNKLERIFEKFFRLDDARSTNTGGTGLGLAIAREIVALHSGTLTAISENERTTFTVTLPCSQSRGA